MLLRRWFELLTPSSDPLSEQKAARIEHQNEKETLYIVEKIKNTCSLVNTYVRNEDSVVVGTSSPIVYLMIIVTELPEVLTFLVFIRAQSTSLQHPAMDLEILPTYERAISCDVWYLIAHHVQNYISTKDLCATILVCKWWAELYTPFLWGNPTSHCDLNYGEDGDSRKAMYSKFGCTSLNHPKR